MSTPTQLLSGKGDRRRAALLAGLAALLAERPFADLNVADVSARAGVTRSAFYFYFSTKFEALGSLLDELEGEFLGIASAWYDGEGDPQTDALRQGMHETVRLWRANAPAFLAMIDAAAVDARSAERWWAFREHFVDRAAARIRADAGDRLRAISPETLSFTLTHGAFAVLEADLRSAAPLPADELGDALTYAWRTAIYGP